MQVFLLSFWYFDKNLAPTSLPKQICVVATTAEEAMNKAKERYDLVVWSKVKHVGELLD